MSTPFTPCLSKSIHTLTLSPFIHPPLYPKVVVTSREVLRSVPTINLGLRRLVHRCLLRVCETLSETGVDTLPYGRG